MQTLHGNPVCASAALAALAVLNTIQTEALAQKSVATGRILIEEISRAASALPEIGDIRGRGLAIGVELVQKDTCEPDAELARKTVYRAWQLGAVFYYVGMNSNVLELTPPLVLSEDEAKTGARILVQAIEDVLSGQISDYDVAAFSGW